MKIPSRVSIGFAIVLCMAVCAAPALATVLGVQQKYQEQTQWCWAAGSQANLEFYCINKTQTEIAQFGVGGANEPNYLYGSDATHKGVDLVMWYLGIVPTTGYEGALTLSSLTAQIDVSRPPIIRWGWDSGGGHIVVIYGVEGSTVYVMDPWYGPTVNTYNWVYRAGGHTWTHTLVMNISPYAAYAYVYAYLGEYYTANAYHYYSNYDKYGYLANAAFCADYAHYYAYYAYLYKAVYGSDYGCSSYAAFYAYYGYVYALSAYTYETGDELSYNGAVSLYNAYIYSYLVTLGY